jgi:hypothetical protein
MNISQLQRQLKLAAHLGEVELAIWFHDAVYDTRRSDNKQKSAEWAEAVIQHSGLSRGIAKWVSSSIVATRDQGGESLTGMLSCWSNLEQAIARLGGTWKSLSLDCSQFHKIDF